ncbi:MAG: sporulation protein [Gammaproteobacteria bacterium]|nr:sporulation protein [Gammaproteobacteria bacterium]
MTGAIASLGIVAGINPSALPAAIAPSAEGTVESTRQPSFTFFTTLEDESFSVDTGRSLDSGPSEYTQYVLQAGSFRAVADADRRRGELALLGLESSIEQMNTDTGSWHRVYIGPFDSRSAMAKARALTAQSDIDTLLLKRAE